MDTGQANMGNQQGNRQDDRGTDRATGELTGGAVRVTMEATG